MNLREAIADNKAISKVVVQTWKAAPGIAFAVGAVGSVASLYLMWRASRKQDEVVEEIKQDLEAVHAQNPADDENVEALSKAEYNKMLFKVWMNAAFKLGKLYGPVVMAEFLSLYFLGKGYGTLKERYVNTLAMASMVETAFSKYRKNVVDTLGEDADQEFRYGLHNKQYDIPELDKDGNPKTDKNGVVKTKKVTERVLENGLEGYSGYARIFDKEHSKRFDDDGTNLATSYYNKEFLTQQQNYFNMMLRYRPNHTVFLNEVYEALGYAPTKEGQVVGWHYDPDYPVGDNEIRFIPIEFYDDRYQARSVILDFNVDGNVWGFL